MEIIKIPLSKLSNYELHSFGKAVLTVISPYDLVALRMDSIIGTLSETFDRFDSVIMRERRSDYTIPLKNADMERDNAGTVFIRVVDTQRLRSNPDVQLAAQKVMRIFELHGKNLHNFNRVEQSGALSNIFNDLDTEEYQAYITLLGAGTFYTELKEAQANYLSVMEDIAEAPLKDGLTLKNTRPELYKTLKKVLFYIDIQAEIENVEPWFEIITKINNTFDKFMDSIRFDVLSKNDEEEEEEEKKKEQENPDGESDSDTEPNPDGEPDPDAGSDTEPNPDGESDPETGNDPEPNPDPDPEPGNE